MYQFKIGESAEVLIYNSNKRKSFWHLCKIDKFVSADDRDYRINVTLNTGEYIEACAPECIRSKI